MMASMPARPQASSSAPAGEPAASTGTPPPSIGAPATLRTPDCKDSAEASSRARVLAVTPDATEQ